MVKDCHLLTARPGWRGFDANTVLTPSAATAFRQASYQFAVRYLRRSAYHDYDLSTREAVDILGAGLGLMAVQHVESAESWVPSPEKGDTYGSVAAQEAAKIGLPHGTMIWCDLEGVTPGTPSPDVAEYCNAWHARVAGAGYLPGLYVGWHAGLTAEQLYRELRFTHYWSAYNLNRDKLPAVRGVQMRQLVAKPTDKVRGHAFAFDVNVVQPDALGGLPTVLIADEMIAGASFAGVVGGSSTAGT